MKEKNNPSLMKSAIGAMMVLVIVFPDYTVQLRKDCIALLKTVDTVKVVEGKIQKAQKEEEFYIDNKNYQEFKKIIIQIFCLQGDKEKEYNPGGDLAQQIADKIRRGKQKKAESEGKDPQKKIAVFSRYASILAVGEAKDLNSLMQYTVYQLFDEFQRFQLKLSYDIYLQAKMAGAKDLKEVDNWMKDIHE